MVREISEPALPRPQRQLFRFAIIGTLAAPLALTLAGCGRQGALDPPPGGYALERLPGRATAVTDRAAPPPQNKQADYDDEGRPVAPRGLKKKLPGDWLID
jgi:predicted small lipoprotein YifL